MIHIPLNIVRLILDAARRIAGEAVFATWEEAELLEVPMISERGAADVRALGVEPAPYGRRARRLAHAYSLPESTTSRPLAPFAQTAFAVTAPIRLPAGGAVCTTQVF